MVNFFFVCTEAAIAMFVKEKDVIVQENTKLHK
jgi:hypothetical protein